jgi:hypothetical protein
VDSRKKALRQVEKLAGSRVNDGVRLAFLKEEELESLEKLDLSAVTEFKRNSNGTVEVKFIDRLSAWQWLSERGEDAPRGEKLEETLRESAQQVWNGDG